MLTIYSDSLNYLPSLYSVSSAYSERINSVNNPDITYILISGIFLIGISYLITLFLSVKGDR